MLECATCQRHGYHVVARTTWDRDSKRGERRGQQIRKRTRTQPNSRGLNETEEQAEVEFISRTTCRHRTFLDRIETQAVASPSSIPSQVVPSAPSQFREPLLGSRKILPPSPASVLKSLLPFTGGCLLPPFSTPPWAQSLSFALHHHQLTFSPPTNSTSQHFRLAIPSARVHSFPVEDVLVFDARRAFRARQLFAWSTCGLLAQCYRKHRDLLG